MKLTNEHIIFHLFNPTEVLNGLWRISWPRAATSGVFAGCLTTACGNQGPVPVET